MFFSDAGWRHIVRAILYSSILPTDRERLLDELHKLWIRPHNPNPVIVTLSARTAFDLYLQVMKFPAGSEMIMSAVNIPDMVTIAKHHKLRIVSLDLSIKTCAPKIELLESLITSNTVAILLAHIYGKWYNLEPFLEMAQKYNLKVIEDCAEGFHGYNVIGHPDADVSLFSFGSIKTQTCFGGAVSKVKNPVVYAEMMELYSTSSHQTHGQMIQTLLKLSAMYIFMRHAWFTKPCMYLVRYLGINHQPHTIRMMRGFPNQLVRRIRDQPSDALVNMLHYR